MNSQESKEVDITPLFRACDIETDPITIIETPGMYPYKEKVEDNWAYFTIESFKQLKKIFRSRGNPIKEIAIVGIGSGVEDIAATLVFGDELEKIIVTDVDEGVVDGAIKNIKSVNTVSPVEIVPLVGSFCEPIERAGYKIDLIHANIPNLPATEDVDLSSGEEKGTFLLPKLYEDYKPHEKFIKWALGSQFAYLQSARGSIHSDGVVVTEIGGRTPLPLVEDLFSKAKFGCEEILVGFKRQTEALIDFEGYYGFEEQYGVVFDFYLYKEACRALSEKGLGNTTTEIVGQEMKDLLSGFRISAKEALELHAKGVSVGHTVHLFGSISQ